MLYLVELLVFQNSSIFLKLFGTFCSIRNSKNKKYHNIKHKILDNFIAGSFGLTSLKKFFWGNVLIFFLSTPLFYIPDKSFSVPFRSTGSGSSCRCRRFMPSRRVIVQESQVKPCRDVRDTDSGSPGRRRCLIIFILIRSQNGQTRCLVAIRGAGCRRSNRNPVELELS